jgi:hypothetical protein
LLKVIVYNADLNRVETYYRDLLEPMPYILGKTMTVGEFRGSSRSNILWSDTNTIAAWNKFRQGWGKSIFIGYAFKRIWEGGHAAQSQHYAGTALDLGHTLSSAERLALRNYAKASGVWSYVEPIEQTPRWVHVDKRYGIPACLAGGFPPLSIGSKGSYVLVLQDALSALGFLGAGLDGVFGKGSQQVISNFQTNQGLYVNGMADCQTWSRLTSLANGIGITPTVIN